MGAVPGRSSIENSTARSGGRPGRSSGKTSGYSLTTGIAFKDYTSKVHIDPEGTGCSGRENYTPGTIWSVQTNCPCRSIYDCSMLIHPIYSQDKIYALM